MPSGKMETDDIFLGILREVWNVLVVIFFMIPTVILVLRIITEKQSGVKEAMKMMGLTTWMHWTAWFVVPLILFLIAIGLLMLLFVIPVPYLVPLSRLYEIKTLEIAGVRAVMYNSNMFLIFLFFLCYALTCITIAFLVSTLFSDVILGGICCVLIVIITWIPYQMYGKTMGYVAKVVCSLLLSNVSVCFGLETILFFEKTGTGVEFSNIFDSPDNDVLPFTLILGCLFLNALMYLLIGLYIDAVYPGPYGIPLSCCFCISPNYWCGESTKHVAAGAEARQSKTTLNLFEEEPKHFRAGIQIQKLRKEFGKVVAVRDVSLNCYEEQITILLGHNGAGKTVTISMLTGLLPPTSGTAYINGYDIRTDIVSVRSSLGLCPQHDVLIEQLTVGEHLYFYSRLKGLGNEEIEQDTTRLLDSVGLKDKRDAVPSSLSGGMKRKLCILISFCGGSKIVIMDEPTAAVDPGSRRAIWELILNERGGRTILITTHFMDEADYLGDRIAVLAYGEVQCCGSSLFLKKILEVGYELVIEKEKEASTSKITKFVQKAIEGAFLQQDIGVDLIYVLPSHNTSKFPTLFHGLESNRRSLGIVGFGATSPNLQQVFIRVGEIADEKKGGKEQKDEEVAMDSIQKLAKFNEYLETTRTSCCFEFLQHLWSQLVKNCMYIWRNWILMALVIFLPAGYMLIQMFFLQAQPFWYASFSRTFTLADYRGPITTVAYASPPATVSEVAKAFKQLSEEDGSTIREVPDGTSVDIVFAGKAVEDPYEYNYKYIIGADFQGNPIIRVSTSNKTQDPDVIGYFGGFATHSTPLSIQEVHSAILASEVGNEKCRFRTTNKPLPQNAMEYIQDNLGTKKSDTVKGQILHLMVPVLGIALSISFTGLSMGLLSERLSKAKHLQIVSGLRIWVYWLGVFIVQYFVYLVTIALVIVAFHAHGGYEQMMRLSGKIFVILATEGFVVLPYMYFLTLLFNSVEIGFIVIFVILLLTATVQPMLIMMTVQLLLKPILDEEVLEPLQEIIYVVFYLVTPQYAMIKSMENLALNDGLNHVCPKLFDSINELLLNQLKMKHVLPNQRALSRDDWCRLFTCSAFEDCYNKTQVCCPPGGKYFTNYFAFPTPGIGGPLFFMVLFAGFYWTLLFLTEFRLFSCVYCRSECWGKAEEYPDTSNEEADVAAERARVLRGGIDGQKRSLSAGRTEVGSKSVQDELTMILEEDVRDGGGIGFSRGRSSMSETEVKFMPDVEDDDVAAERWRIVRGGIDQLTAEGDLLIIKNATKVFPCANRKSVDHICVGIRVGECFGLLGTNGAGKTTTMDMIAGYERLTDGEIYINGNPVSPMCTKALENISYCPQSGGFMGDLTPTEAFTLFARIRAIPERSINELVEILQGIFMLKDHMQKPMNTLSGGTRQKVICAVALIGLPIIVMLDEPTTGIDAVSRKMIWNAISKTRESGRLILLTSHNMEESEALCTRLVIMVKGRFRCIGSVQRLRNKFGSVFRLEVKVKKSVPSQEDPYAENGAKLEAFISKSFPGAQLKSFRQGLFRYEIPSHDLPWSKAFNVLESNKHKAGIAYYSLGQPTLEEKQLTKAYRCEWTGYADGNGNDCSQRQSQQCLRRRERALPEHRLKRVQEHCHGEDHNDVNQRLERQQKRIRCSTHIRFTAETDEEPTEMMADARSESLLWEQTKPVQEFVLTLHTVGGS
ncbi:unnamed protein product [Cyprideis torosa]|uniref:Uncharacterized protein n=1 Tax=Cyprideis torosa TaxID=163714 RepID=A0A7R8WEL4_9CRUS|nr:unnamed protein product [Cyprideis torosa]CAG0889944.1 unnamed protein product [Cyprideis torosa]